MKNLLATLCLPVFLLVSPSVSTAADKPWVEAKSAHFVVVSDAGEKTAREIVWQFEQIRAAIQVAWPWARVDLDKPVLVLAARDENSMKVLAPQFWEERGAVKPGSIFVTGADKHYIALRADANAEDTDAINPYNGAYWSYASLALQTSDLTRDLPMWFDRGLASVMSNTIVRSSSIQIGRPLPWLLQRIRNGERLPIRALLAVDRNSPWYSQNDKLLGFDAQCWGLVHYLMFGDMGAHRPQINRFVALIAEGKAPLDAFQLAFGNLDLIEKALAVYFAQPLWLYEKNNVDLGIKREAFASRTLSPGEAAATRAAFHVTMRRPAEARALVAEARKTEPAAPASYDVEGLVLDTEGKYDEARAAYAKAIELGSTQYFSPYRWAALTGMPDSNADTTARIVSALERSVTLNNGFGPAYALLADAKVLLNHPDEALGLAKRAVALDPGQMRHRLTVALVLQRLSRSQEAEQEARAALRLAKNDADRQAAQQVLDFLARSAAPPPK